MWPEVEKAQTENRHELVLSGVEIAKRIAKDGLDDCIFQLSSINYLAIHDAFLALIPDSIQALKSLQTLSLHTNMLQLINSQVYALTKLKVLDLSHNSIKEVSDELDSLVNLETLNLSSNCLETFPKLTKTTKLTVLDLSNNNLKEFPVVCNEEFKNLFEIHLGKNAIEIVPPEISLLKLLKVLELGDNKIKAVPGNLAKCTKLKTLDLKNNPIADNRLKKLINGNTIKQVLEYIDKKCPKTADPPKDSGGGKNNKGKNNVESDEEDGDTKHTIRIHHASDNNFRIIASDDVIGVRDYIVACVIKDITFTEDSFKKFIKMQNKLHDTVCGKRVHSTIATHDRAKLPPGDLTYMAQELAQLQIKPLNQNKEISGKALLEKLQDVAESFRKDQKLNSYSGIHKYLYLLKDKPKLACLLNSANVVISLPPLTNSDVTKIDVNTKSILLEVTSDNLKHCKHAMECLIKETILLLGTDLDIIQVRCVGVDGTLKVVYPAKDDMLLEPSSGIKVQRK